jgi:photosystem II stability/assembly factor-like uncharacterized protein
MNSIDLAPIFAIVLSPNFEVDGLAYAASEAGLRESSDGGTSWKSLDTDTPFIQDTPTTAIALSPNFAADGTIFAAIQGAILYSYDCGVHWEISSLGLPPPVVSAIGVSPNFSQDHTLFVTTLEDGVFCSTDGGKTLERRSFHLYDVRVNCIAMSPKYHESNSLWVGTEISIFCSVNGARSWQENIFPIEAGPVLSIAVSKEGVLFAGTESNGVFESTDSGTHWQLIPETSALHEVSKLIPYQDEVLILAEDGLYHLQCTGEQPTLNCLQKDELILSVALHNGKEKTCLIGSNTGQILKLQIK